MSNKNKTILVIGCGIAGLSASIRCAEQGLNVILASHRSSERAQSVMAAGGINVARTDKESDDSVDLHAQETLKGGCFIEDPAATQTLAENATEALKWLEGMGVVFNREADGTVSRRAFGGQSRKRTAFSGSSTGKQIVTAEVQRCREFVRQGLVTRRYGLRFHSALIADGACYGALFLDEASEKLVPIFADAVIMATGGQNLLFGKTTGSVSCDGYAAGKLFEQGVQMRNLEFCQFHPTTIETPQKRMLITEASRGEGGRLYYEEEGKRIYFMEDLYGAGGNLMPRDIVARHIYEAPSQVYLDISFLGAKVIHSRLEEVFQLCSDYLGIDVTKESIPVAPSVHFFMGGISVDAAHQTNIQGLYAAGECASRYHGANRLGGNSLLAAVVSGRIAAEDVACSEQRRSLDELPGGQSFFDDYIASSNAAIAQRAQSHSSFPATYIESSLAETMNKHLGISRYQESMEEGLESILFLKSVVSKLKYDPEASTYYAFRLPSMVLLAEAMMRCAIARKETRGSHIRSDYPQTDPQMTLCTLAQYADGEIVITHVKENNSAGESYDRSY